MRKVCGFLFLVVVRMAFELKYHNNLLELWAWDGLIRYTKVSQSRWLRSKLYETMANRTINLSLRKIPHKTNIYKLFPHIVFFPRTGNFSHGQLFFPWTAIFLTDIYFSHGLLILVMSRNTWPVRRGRRWPRIWRWRMLKLKHGSRIGELSGGNIDR